MAIVLFTDFGATDIYVGQVKTVLHERAPGQAVIDLLHDVPAFDIESAAHLLAACLPRFAPGTVFLAVVDPGVGTDRDAVVAQVDGRCLVGPDNGLLSVCAARASEVRCWSIASRAAAVSVSFHGRDVFAPVAADIARGSWPRADLAPRERLAVQLGAAPLERIIYIDHYGNACTGIPAGKVRHDQCLKAAGRRIAYQRVFGEAAPASSFWYENSIGLVEIAVNRGSAAGMLGLHVGDAVTVD